jgi:sulfide:quinone oxidoreductase
MSTNIVVLGAGFGGLEVSTGLKRELADDVSVTLIDKKDHFMAGFNKYDIIFGRENTIRKGYYTDLKKLGIKFFQDTVTALDLNGNRIVTDKQNIPYDYLIVALGADLAPEIVPGFTAAGYEFYSPEGAAALHQVIGSFDGGTILISIFDKPYKCPPAPYEMAFLLDDYFTGKGIRDRVRIRILIPFPRTIPVAPAVSDEIERLLKESNVELLTRHRVVGLDTECKEAAVEGKEPIPYDLFLGVPVHRVPKVILESPLGAQGWIVVDRDTLRTSFENVYAVGDITDIPVGGFAVPKAGVFAENAGKIVVQDIVSRIGRAEPPERFTAKGACFLEVGRGRLLKLDADFLGGPEPRIVLQTETEGSVSKQNFVKERLHRWFGYAT